MQAMANLSNEKLRLQCSHPITKLYGWSHFLLRRDASRLYATVVDLAMPPDVETTSEINQPSSTSMTLCLYFFLFSVSCYA